MKRKTCLRFLFALTSFIWFVSCTDKEKDDVNNDIFDAMRHGYDQMSFLTDFQKKDLASIPGFLDAKFDSIGFQKADDVPFVIGSDTIAKPKDSFAWINQANGTTVFINEFETSSDANSHWSEVSKHIGRYTGITMGASGTYYLNNDSVHNTSLNATFKSNKKVFQLRRPLEFVLYADSELKNEEWAEFFLANTSMAEVLELLINVLVSEKNKIYRPMDGRALTENERLIGFFKFWTEVKYNFAFFDQVPELDWEQVLMDYIPKVRNTTSNMEYYKVLQEVCALLNDGHTNIYLPSALQNEQGSPAVTVTSFDDTLFVTNVDKKLEKDIPLGSQIIEVNDLPVEKYIEKYVRPYISSSTYHIRRNAEARDLLKGNRMDPILVKIKTPDNHLKQLALSRNPSESEWVIPSEPWELSSFKKIGDVAYVALNSFGNDKIVVEFESYLDSIQSARALIIDLRKNGGGNSWNGYKILRYFTDQLIITSKWKTREHKPAFKAWGAFVDENSENLGSWERETLASYKDDYWFESGPDTISPNNDRVIKLPTVVLIGNNTASAAEDFLVAADPIGHFETMGDYSYGSTGQPMFVRLPGGGQARICTKRDTYPDGSEFVGYGIQPDIVIPSTLKDMINGEDSVLDKALKKLMERI